MKHDPALISPLFSPNIQAQVKVIPAARVVTVNKGDPEPVPWWVFFVAAVGALIVIAVMTVLLQVVS